MNTNIATEVEKLTNTALPLMEKLDAAKSLEKQIQKQIVELAAEREQEIKKASDLEKRVAAAVEHAFVTSKPQKYKGNSRRFTDVIRARYGNWLSESFPVKETVEKILVSRRVIKLFEAEKAVNLTRSRGWLHEEERIKIAFYAQNLPKVTSRANCVLHLTHIAAKFNCSVGTVSRYADYGEPWNPTKSM
jgi:uncharacterized NAD(P)/FAD-binding protein YdhS